MTTTLLVMVAVAALAGMAAWWQQQRVRPAPTTTPGAPPGNLDRSEFLAPTAPLLIAVFTSETCSSCDAVWAELSGYESATVAAQNVEVTADPALHSRYGIDSVPTAVIVDAAGETQAAFVGPLGPEHRIALRDLIAQANSH
jgi:thioredoxin-related protein